MLRYPEKPCQTVENKWEELPKPTEKVFSEITRRNRKIHSHGEEDITLITLITTNYNTLSISRQYYLGFQSLLKSSEDKELAVLLYTLHRF